MGEDVRARRLLGETLLADGRDLDKISAREFLRGLRFPAYVRRYIEELLQDNPDISADHSAPVRTLSAVSALLGALRAHADLSLEQEPAEELALPDLMMQHNDPGNFGPFNHALEYFSSTDLDIPKPK